MIFALTLNWNGSDKLAKLAPGLFQNFENINVPYKWLIRDNGSKDDSCEIIKTFKMADLYAIDHNRDNFAKGMNFLVHQLMKENEYQNFNEIDPMNQKYKDIYLLLLNNDVQFVDNESLSKMFKLISGNYQVAAVGARLLYCNTNKLQHAGIIGSVKYNKNPYHFRHKEESDIHAEKNRYFQAVTAAVCLVRLSDFLAVDGFDEKYQWCFEDVDLMLKLNKNLGKKIIYCGETKIFHEESATIKKNPVNQLFMPQNVSLFKKKWSDKFEMDHDLYLKDLNYNLV